MTLGFGLTNAHVVNAPNNRNTPTWNVENTLSWLKGSHSVTLRRRVHAGDRRKRRLEHGADDHAWPERDERPGQRDVQHGNFSGASDANLTSARQLYALLTGRVTEVDGTSRLNADTGVYDTSDTSTASRR